MEQITKHNVEAYLLDYQEGNLSADLVPVLMDFLKKHPELNLDPDYSDFPVLEAPRLGYPGVADLFKPGFYLPDLTDAETECIARMEGDLEEREAAAFDQNLAGDSSRALLYESLLRTRLEPDLSIRFPHSNHLKKKRVLLPPVVYPILSIAALLIIAFFVFSPLSEKGSDAIPMASDTTREIIFLNKLAHPSQFDRIARAEPRKLLIPPSQIKEAEPEREEVFLELADRLPVSSVSSLSENPNSDFALVQRLPSYTDPQSYQSLLAFSGEMIRERILGQDPELVKRTRFSFWELADAGLEKLSSIFSLPVDLNRKYNKEGELVSVAFDSRLVAFSTPIHGGRNRQIQEGL